ncbi:MAG: ABC transporter substrate-binding protein [Thermogemmatispora sp.]|uniref:ABC transporter substrate-binding protein n=1 Tax=Thermogemmatispora sp. TaxID=1968838 RepID=UPI0026231558|nr:ABC transporter substrate-binding protein [Thermogemmatispora sp.]MBX5458658.1 ABC transporter substrate-binding protein [Thermogemmatispora sp.]
MSRRLAQVGFLLLFIVILCWLCYKASGSAQLTAFIGLFIGVVGVVLQFHEARMGFIRLLKALGEDLATLVAKTRFWMMLTCVLLLVFLGWNIIPRVWPHVPSAASCSLPRNNLVSSAYLGVTKTPAGELIGVSDGSAVLDTSQPDLARKQEAAQQYSAGNLSEAQSLWQNAAEQVTNDAEARIYAENVAVEQSGLPSITLVVATRFTPHYLGGARDILQGAYVAQRIFNDSHTLRLRLLLANAGSGGVAQVTCQIIQAARVSSASAPIVGIVGWELSQDVSESVTLVDQAHLPMLSPTASGNDLRNLPYFARIAPPDALQGEDAALYARQTLEARRVALFEDPRDKYSQSLASSFRLAFEDASHHITVTEEYHVGQPDNLPQLLQDALRTQPDLIYFAGYSADVSVLLAALPPCQPVTALATARCPLVLGGDALYIYGNYAQEARPSFHSGRLYFTAFAFPDEWQGQPLPQMETFLETYAASFGPTPAGRSPYGYTRPDADSMLAYDAVSVLAEACYHLFQQRQPLTGARLQQALLQMRGEQAWQGITGVIAFGSDGNVLNKPVLLLHLDQAGHTQVEQVWGCLIKERC